MHEFPRRNHEIVIQEHVTQKTSIYICRVHFIILYRLLLVQKLCKSNLLYDAIIQVITCTNIIVPVITCTMFVEKKIITCITHYL